MLSSSERVGGGRGRQTRRRASRLRIVLSHAAHGRGPALSWLAVPALHGSDSLPPQRPRRCRRRRARADGFRSPPREDPRGPSARPRACRLAALLPLALNSAGVARRRHVCTPRACIKPPSPTLRRGSGPRGGQRSRTALSPGPRCSPGAETTFSWASPASRGLDRCRSYARQDRLLEANWAASHARRASRRGDFRSCPRVDKRG